MIAASPFARASECEQLLEQLSRYDAVVSIKAVLRDAKDILRLLALYSFRSPQRAERLCAELSSRYRKEILFLYGSAVLLRRQSDSCYLRLEQLLPVLIRVAALRLSQEGILSLSHAQLMQSDGMLLRLLQKAEQQKTGG